MGSLVLYFFQIVLGISSYFRPDMINKCIRFSWVFFQKNLKLVSDYGSKLIVLYTSLMLLPLIKNMVFQESYNKKYTFMA